MPFVTACPYCPAKMKVPDLSLGGSLCCPKCGNNFTVAPAELEAVKNPAPEPVAREHVAAAVEPPPPTEEVPWWVAPTVPVAAPPPAPAPLPARPEPPPPSPAITNSTHAPIFFEPAVPMPEVRSSWVNSWSACALILAALALLFAVLAFPRWLPITLAAFGCLVALIGVLAARENWEPRDVVWLGLGGGGNALLLILVLSVPSWLNNQWGRDFEVPPPDLNQQVMVSRDNTTDVKTLTTTDWVEADKNAIRQGDVLVRIESVAVDRVEGSDYPSLLIKLHLANVGQLHEVLYHGQASDAPPPIVRDSRGRRLHWSDLGVHAKKAGQVGTVSVFPTHEVNDLLVFESPWPGPLELELPASAWGREGFCKFRIPNEFIRHNSRPK